MSVFLSNPLASLIAALAMGVSSIIIFVGRQDRAQGSGCFYSILVGLIAILAVVFLSGISG